MVRWVLIIIFVQAAMSAPLGAQVELSIYGGFQSSPDSNVSGNDPGGIGVFDFSAEWESRSLRAPPNYGARLTWWPSRVLGLGVDYSYDKLFGSAATLADNGLTQLEFSEGLNLLTLNAYRRWPLSGSEITPYIGAGIGVSVPFVEFDSGAGRTAEYQIGGPAVRWLAGAIYPVNDRWSVFGEYRGSFSQNNLDLDSGGTLSTDIFSNSLTIGLTLGF